MEEAIEKVRIGGLKVVEGGACVVSSWQSCAVRLDAEICAPLALRQINLTLLTHVGGDRGLDCVTVFCSEIPAGTASYSLLKARNGDQGLIRLHPGISIISLYPHEKRPEIAGRFIRSLAQARVMIRALASSRSAISGVIASEAKDKAIRALFNHFDFSSYRSPGEFYASQSPPEGLIREVIAAYQEKVIRIYCLEHQSNLDLWEVRLPSVGALGDFAEALIALGEMGLRMPILVAVPAVQKRELLISFSLCRDEPPRDPADEISRVLNSYLSGITTRRQTPVAAIFVHGPHFGDRFGIAHTLVEALERARVSLLAISCSISSISAIIRQPELTVALQVLGKTFEMPG